jgi:hypothetical protein
MSLDLTVACANENFPRNYPILNAGHFPSETPRQRAAMVTAGPA